MILMILLFVVLCCVAAFVPMPQPLRVGLYVAAAVVVVLLILALVGYLPADWRRLP